MKLIRNDDEGLKLVRELSEQIARLEGQLADLTRQKDRTAELRQVEDRLETARREKARLTEEHDREVRETEHRVGLLRLQQEHEVANAKRETELEVREGNLARERKQFTHDMEFMRDRMQGEVDRIERLMTAVLERLPNVEASFTRTDRTGTAPVRKAKAKAAEG